MSSRQFVSFKAENLQESVTSGCGQSETKACMKLQVCGLVTHIKDQLRTHDCPVQNILLTNSIVGLNAELVPIYNDDPIEGSELYVRESGIQKSLKYKFICRDLDGSQSFAGKIVPEHFMVDHTY
jgi:hypothetical protein